MVNKSTSTSRRDLSNHRVANSITRDLVDPRVVYIAHHPRSHGILDGIHRIIIRGLTPTQMVYIKKSLVPQRPTNEICASMCTLNSHTVVFHRNFRNKKWLREGNIILY